MEQEYKQMRAKYTPKDIKVVFILESPPASKAYFYNTSGRTSEVLFRAFMKLMEITPQTKKEGLEKFSERGWIIVDPIYEPVNKLPDNVADQLILENYPNFISDLSSLMDNKSTPIVIVKANVLKLLEHKLINDGFNVINKGVSIPFPLHYHIKSFIEKSNCLLSQVNSPN